MTPDQTKYPEHEKLKAVRDQRDTVQRFIDWLLDEYEVETLNEDGDLTTTHVFVAYRGHFLYTDENMHEDLITSRKEEVRPLIGGNLREKLIADFFDIDPVKLEEEKRAILELFRRSS